MKREEIKIYNSNLNGMEYESKKIKLKSYPTSVFIQMDAPCNHDCVFCSRPSAYSHFDLDDFRENFEKILSPLFERVERINLTGSGELLFLPEAKRNLEYFNQMSGAEKMFATNGSSLTPKMIDFILDSENRYLLHVSLHCATPATHQKIVKADTYESIIENLRYLQKRRAGKRNLRVNLVFVATGLNIAELPEFIKLAEELEVDGVVAYYNYIYRLDQRDVSCYFKKKITNEILSRVSEYAKKSELDISLPPFFSKEYDADTNICNEAWSQVMINSRGDVLSCDVGGDSPENLKGKKSFMEVWNGPYYMDLRARLVNNEFDCASFCWRANPSRVNDLRSHIISRGKSPEEMEMFLKK